MDASHDPAGPPNYYNSFERSVCPPTDGTGNVSSFTSFAGGSPLGLRSASENNVQEYNFPGTVGTIRRGGSISTNREETEKSLVSASIAESMDFGISSVANDKRMITSIKAIHDSIRYGNKKEINTSTKSFDAHIPNPFTS